MISPRRGQAQILDRDKTAKTFFNAAERNDRLICHGVPRSVRRQKDTARKSGPAENSGNMEPNARVLGNLAGKRIWLRIWTGSAGGFLEQLIECLKSRFHGQHREWDRQEHMPRDRGAQQGFQTRAEKRHLHRRRNDDARNRQRQGDPQETAQAGCGLQQQRSTFCGETYSGKIAIAAQAWASIGTTAN